jgi:hypothetical protein
VASDRDSSRGIVIAALIVVANFVLVLQVTGISYGRFQWAAFAGAYDTPTPTPTATATATPTPTPLPDGASCGPDDLCASTFCVEGLCCNSACDQPGARCDLPGREGLCVDPASAPAMSSGGLAAAVALLMVISALALRATRRRDRAR